MTARGMDHQYDPGVKGQCQVYQKLLLWLVNANSSYTLRVFIFRWQGCYDLRVNVKVK